MLDGRIVAVGSSSELRSRFESPEYALPGDSWPLGRGWELSIFPEGNAPAALLDALAPEHPVALEGADTPDPPNGVIERDGDGAPSGTLRESAQNLLDPYLPEADRAQRLEALRAAQSHAHSLGITSLIDAAVGPEEISLWRELEARGELQLRVRGSLDLSGSFSDEADRRELHAVSESPGTLLRLDSAKLFLDGVLEGETAALLEPYASGSHGNLNLPWVARMYPIGPVHRAGGRVVGGSDWPVSAMNPLPAIEIALTRRNPDGRIEQPLNEAERVDLSTMLAAYTREAAWLMHQENRTGRIRPGYLADLVVLDAKLTALPAEAIGEVRVRWTLFEGRTVHGGPDAAAPATAPAKAE